jgi:hypothetical protein
VYSSNAQPTGTNRPRACLTTSSPQQFLHRCLASTTQFPTNKPPTGGQLVWNPELNKAWKHPHTPKRVMGACVSARVTAAIAKGKHPVPSRTRKLSLSAPMVLQPEGCGRVGRRRTIIETGPPLRGWPCRHFRIDQLVAPACPISEPAPVARRATRPFSVHSRVPGVGRAQAGATATGTVGPRGEVGTRR